MTFQAYEKSANHKPAPTLLKLRTNSDGSVSVVVVDENGQRHMGGDVLRFNSDGTLSLMRFASHSLGLVQAQDGSIKLRPQ